MTIQTKDLWFVDADHTGVRHLGPEHKAMRAKLKAAGLKDRTFTVEAAAKQVAANLTDRTGIKTTITKGFSLAF